MTRETQEDELAWDLIDEVPPSPCWIETEHVCTSWLSSDVLYSGSTGDFPRLGLVYVNKFVLLEKLKKDGIYVVLLHAVKTLSTDLPSVCQVIFFLKKRSKW